jgi:hypothetical protein
MWGAVDLSLRIQHICPTLNSPGGQRLSAARTLQLALHVALTFVGAACTSSPSDQQFIERLSTSSGGELHLLNVARVQYDFHFVIAVAVHRDGRLFVADRGSGQILIFDGNRRPFSLPPPPGDRFANPSDLAVVGDTLYVFDSLDDRLSLFRVDTPEPEFLDAIDLYHPLLTARKVLVAPDHSVFAIASPPQLQGNTVNTDSMTVYAVSEESPVLDTSLFHLLADERLFTITSTGGTVESIPFGKKSLVGVTPAAELVHMWTGQSFFTEYRQHRAPRRIMSSTMNTSPVTSTDLDALHVSLSSMGSIRDSLKANRLSSAREDGRLPNERPTASGLVVDSRARVWIMATSSSDSIYYHPYGYSYTPYGHGVPSLIMIDVDTRREYTGRLPVKGELGAVSSDQLYLVSPQRYQASSIHIIGWELPQ